MPALEPGQTYVEIAAGADHTLLRRSDGWVVAFGNNSHGECNVPALPSGLSYVEVATQQWHSVARRSDGAVLAWGNNDKGQCDIAAPPPGLTYVGIAAGGNHTLALRSDGSVVVFGDIPLAPDLPPGLTYVETSAGAYHAVARRSNGSVVVWGTDNAYGQLNPAPTPAPGNVFVKLSAGTLQNVARSEPGGFVAVYCTAKITSSGCVPAISASGVPSASGNFRAHCSQVEPGRSGLFIYGVAGPAALPFLDGILCVQPPLTRLPSPALLSGGLAACSGHFSLDLAGLIASLPIGQTVNCQYWFRDPLAPSAIGLSDGLEFIVQ